MTVILREAKNDVRDKVWKVIRGLVGGFSYDEVTMLTEAPYQSVSKYLIQLYHAGYIRPAGKREEADGRKKVVWRLVKNTGPKAPVPCRCLYDPNIDGLAEVKNSLSLNPSPQGREKLKGTSEIFKSPSLEGRGKGRVKDVD